MPLEFCAHWQQRNTSIYNCLLFRVFMQVNGYILSSPMQALHEALMRQEELLAYIDRQENAKYRVSTE